MIGPVIPEGGVAVLLARTGTARPDQLDQPALLDDAERGRRGELLRDPDRDRFTVGAVLLRTAVAAETGLPAGQVVVRRDCPGCARPHGRPVLPGTGLHASVSHSGEVVAVALTRLGPVGVDVEAHVPLDHAALHPLLLGPGELAGDLGEFYRTWTRKEAVLKATGDGLRVPMAELSVGPPGRPPRLLAYPGRPDLVVALADLAIDDGYWAALAVLGGPPTVVRLVQVGEPGR